MLRRLSRRSIRAIFVVAILVGCLTAAWSEGPPFVVGRSGWAENMREVLPTRKYNGDVFRSGRRHVWIAVKLPNVNFRKWRWTRFGPYEFKGGTRYYSHIRSHGYIVAPDYNAALSKLGPAESSLSFENTDGRDTIAYLLGNPLPEAAASRVPTEATRASLTGAWNVNQSGASRDARWVLSQRSSSISGTQSVSGNPDSWSITGSLHGTKLQLVSENAGRNARVHYSGTVDGGGRIVRGTYTWSCDPYDKNGRPNLLGGKKKSGTWTARRQH